MLRLDSLMCVVHNCLMTDRRDFYIKQGSTWPGWSWPIYDSNNPDTLLDLTGWSAKSQIRPNANSSTLYWTWSSSPSEGEGTITLSDGHVGISLTDEESQQFDWHGPAGYDIEAYTPDGETILISTGSIHIERNYTRET